MQNNFICWQALGGSLFQVVADSTPPWRRRGAMTEKWSPKFVVFLSRSTINLFMKFSLSSKIVKSNTSIISESLRLD
jgi:hypothetical protein